VESPGVHSGSASTHTGPAGTGRPEPGQESWRALIERALSDLQAAARTRIHLAGLESRRALQISAGAAVLAGLAGLLLVTAWFTLIAAVVAWAAFAGVRTDLALLVIAVLCALGGWLSLRGVRAAFARIRFDATLRALKGTRATAAHQAGDATQDGRGGL